MRHRAARRLCAGVTIAAIAAASLVALASSGEEQPIAGSMLKAAFILNFVKFTEWPPRDAGLPISVCVHGDESIAEALTRTSADQKVDGRAVPVVRVAPGESLRDCQVLFIAEREPRRFAAIVQDSTRYPILTVSDTERSTARGVMIEFFLKQDRLRFAVNIDTLARARLKLSSRVLALADIVRDGGGR